MGKSQVYSKAPFTWTLSDMQLGCIFNSPQSPVKTKHKPLHSLIHIIMIAK